MSDTVVLVRHIGGETVYDTTTFVTENGTGVLLVYSDPSKRTLIAAYNLQAWIAAEFVEKVIDDDASENAVEAERPL